MTAQFRWNTQAWRAGKKAALDEVVELLYQDLRKIAASNLRRERGPVTLQTADLIGELYVRLEEGVNVDWSGRAHFYAVCSQIMRRIFVEQARRRQAVKRGGGVEVVTFDENFAAGKGRSVDILTLNLPLLKLEQLDPLKWRLVELPFFSRLTIKDCAEALGASTRQINSGCRFAKAWLAEQLFGEVAAR